MNIKNFFIFLVILFGCESSSDSVNFGGLSGSNDFSGGSESGTGIGGSMARFTISGDYLYTVDSWNLNTFEITDPINPVNKPNILPHIIIK